MSARQCDESPAYTPASATGYRDLGADWTNILKALIANAAPSRKKVYQQ
jgi:hypothetical protein